MKPNPQKIIDKILWPLYNIGIHNVFTYRVMLKTTIIGRGILLNIRKKVTSTIIVLIVLSIAASSIFIYLESSRVLTTQISSSMLSVIKSEEGSITTAIERDKALAKYLSANKEISDFLASPNDTSRDNSIKVLNGIMDKNRYEHIFIVDKNGINVADTDSKLIGKDMNSRNYTKETLSKKQPKISEVIKSVSTGAMIIVFTSPVFDPQTKDLLGFVATSVITDSLANNIKLLKVNGDKTSYAYLVDETGNMIFHPTADKIGKPVTNEQIKSVVKRQQNGENVDASVVNYTYEGAEKIAAYSVIPQTKWTLVLTGDIKNVLSPVYAMTLYILFIGLGIVILASAIGFIISKRISKPIVTVTKLINKTAQLDLQNDQSFEALTKSKDETGIMANAMMEMRKSLRDIAKLLLDSSHDIYNNSEVVGKITSKLHDNSNDNSSTTQQLSAGMEETAASSEEISASIDQVGSNVDVITEKTKNGLDLSVEIIQRADNLKKDAVASKQNAETIYTDVKGKMEKALEKSKAVVQVNVLANAILSIAEQTNLLSLNAAIEAARAGESGRGFSVVADEIRKLADESSKTAADIQKIIKDVNTAVGDITNSSIKVLEFLDNDVTNDYGNFIKVSEQYSLDASAVNEMMAHISQSTEELSAIMNDIEKAVSEVAVTVNEEAKGVTNIAMKTSDTVELTEKVKKSTEESIKYANKLQSIVGKFKL
jgi:methyl-accepting chemotaxis protein